MAEETAIGKTFLIECYKWESGARSLLPVCFLNADEEAEPFSIRHELGEKEMRENKCYEAGRQKVSFEGEKHLSGLFSDARDSSACSFWMLCPGTTCLP